MLSIHTCYFLDYDQIEDNFWKVSFGYILLLWKIVCYCDEFFASFNLCLKTFRQLSKFPEYIQIQISNNSYISVSRQSSLLTSNISLEQTKSRMSSGPNRSSSGERGHPHLGRRPWKFNRKPDCLWISKKTVGLLYTGLPPSNNLTLSVVTEYSHEMFITQWDETTEQQTCKGAIAIL